MEKFQRIKFEQNSFLAVTLTKMNILLIISSSAVIGAHGMNQNPSGVLNPRVIGGTDAVAGQATYMVALMRNGKFDCGGSIINADTILTAGHCVQNQDTYVVRAGSLYWNKDGLLYKTTWMKQHPDYNLIQPKNYDIGIIRITGKFKLSNDVSIVKLVPAGTAIPVGKIGTVNGWGVTNVDPPKFPSKLQTVDLNVVSNEDCETIYPGEIQPEMMCAGSRGIGKDACFGDSGGPLTIGNVQYGVVSWGPDGKCASEEQPYGVYANVAALHGWIHDSSQAINRPS